MRRHRSRLPKAGVCLLALLVLAGAVYAVWGAFLPAAYMGDDMFTTGQANTEQEWRAVWISYLEYQQMDLSGEESARAEFSAVFDNVAAAGFNTVVAQVRPFGDALYASSVFPWSHLLTGTQGQDPGYDPLALMIELAHERGLRLEAWVNPYRVQGGKTPAPLAPENPAVLWQANPETSGWIHLTDTGMWYDPGVPEVQALIVQGVTEICANYEVDGIQFDDYFYPTTDEPFDASTYAAYSNGQALADWRRSNVDNLIQQVGQVIEECGHSVVFGISPQGNQANNYDQQYSDIARWAQEGWVDYICPQLYWGFDYRTESGSDAFAFQNCLQSWCAVPRAENVALYIGLGAWRVGEGDGSAVSSQEWYTGQNLAKQVAALREASAQGYAIYRYDSLWNGANDLCASELAALAKQNGVA